jgi:hypothetical protein
MITNGANSFAGQALTDGAAVSASCQTLGAGAAVNDPCQTLGVCAIPTAWFEPPSPVAAFDYVGRVSTFYNAVLATYCESYEPARESASGLIGRIESRKIRGCWRHLAFRPSGVTVTTEADDFLLFDQAHLPLMFTPENELAFAKKMLSKGSRRDLVNLPKDVLVYANKDLSSIGIIRLKFAV